MATCTAHTTSHKPCRRDAIKGGTVCWSHGGSAPRVKAKAKERLAEKAMHDTLGKLNIRPVADPLTALAELAGEILAWKQLASEKVAELRSLDTFNPQTGDEVRATVVVFERALDRSVTVLATIARLNIDERLAKISAEQAELMKQVLAGGMTDAGLPTAQRAEVLGHVTRRLRLIAS